MGELEVVPLGLVEVPWEVGLPWEETQMGAVELAVGAAVEWVVAGV